MKKVEINEKMKLSEHFTLGELCKTSYHTTDGNIPSRVSIENLKNICENWLEDLRYSQNTLYGDCSRKEERLRVGELCSGMRGERKENTQVADIPIIISSGYRSEEVNMKCGGAKNSNHLTGCAVDIKCYGPEQMIRMAGILLDIADGTKRDFDELILEKRGTTYWIHFAVRPKDNRRKILFDCR